MSMSPLRSYLPDTRFSTHLPQWRQRALVTSIALALSALAPASVQAADFVDDTPELTDDTALPSVRLDPIVVTATRSERALSDAPVAMQVLSRQTLDDNHAHTLKEALALLPNVYLREVHGKTGYEVSMQGFTGDQVLVLIDGLPITASTGSTVNLNQYMNMDIEQIEVVQGAASAQFGSAAMGGVINIITKPIGAATGHITTEIASNGEQNPSGKGIDANKRYVEASVEGALDKDQRFQARLSGSYLDNDGLSLDHKAWPRLKDASEQSQISARLSYRPDGKGMSNDSNSSDDSRVIKNTQYWLEASHYKEDDVSRFNYYVAPRYLAQQRDEHISKQRFSVGARADITPHADDRSKTYRLSAQALHEDYQSESNTKTQQTITSARDTDISTTLAQAQLDLPELVLSGDHIHLIQVGGQLQQDKLSQTKNQVSELISNEVSRDVGELYIQDDWLIGDNWEVLSGIRYQNDEDFGSHTAPKVSLKYNLMDASGREHILRGSIGGGYRVPNLKERYYVFDHSNLGYKVMGNPNLQPETSTSYQIGYQGQLSDTLNLTVNGFYNDVDDLIQTDEDNATFDGNIAVYQFMNVDSAKTYGGDIGIDWQVDERAKLQASYAYLKTHNNVTDTELTYKPNHKAMLALDYQINDKLQLIPRLNYESKQLVSTSAQTYSPSWWTLDSKLNYDMTANLSVYAAINNIFDVQRDVTDASDYRPIDNREWLLGARYHW
ncbi:TonB-dependent receptor plug domain-containing protein [Psychrobacter celer]|uniref:TonB-dependent receptor plug domain-containing protein n=1 Tax=Psychrobacter TaxID=497 RepID=UPI000C2A84E2|nr:TonB-dependent receptor [Psychrobacter sp. L7]PJX24151.1 TonB-dependent receptor [Psychrobacter sp. L7]